MYKLISDKVVSLENDKATKDEVNAGLATRATNDRCATTRLALSKCASPHNPFVVMIILI
jgi:hypothetical protein